MGVSPTQNTLKKLRREGWVLVEVTEHWDSFSRRRKDLFGFVDIIALRDGQTLAVQTTSFDNSTSRRRKILESEALPVVLAAGWEVRVHGWKKIKNRWVCHRDEQLTVETIADYQQANPHLVEQGANSDE